MAVSYLDRQVLGVLAPSVRADLRIDHEAYGWIGAAFSYAYLVATPIAGRLIERIGVRRGLWVAVALWSVVSAAHGLATSFAVLFAMRLALGVTEAPSFPGAAAAVSRTLPPAHRPRGLGVLFTGSSIGAMVAPPLAATLAVWLGSWRFGFAAVALVGVLWIPLWLAVTSPREIRALLDAPPDPGAPRPSLWAVLGRRPVVRAVALVLAGSPACAFFFLWSSLYLHDAHGVSQGDVGDYLWLPPLLLDLGAVAFGFLAGRHAAEHGAERSPLALATIAALLTGAIAAVPLAPDATSATLLFGVAMAGAGGLSAILTADVMAGVGPGLAASAGGITAAAQSVAYVIASPLIGRAVEATGHYDLALVALGAWLVPGTVVWIALRPRPGSISGSSSRRRRCRAPTTRSPTGPPSRSPFRRSSGSDRPSRGAPTR